MLRSLALILLFSWGLGCAPAESREATDAAPATDAAQAKIQPAAAMTAAPGDWPRWRGPAQTGISTETSWRSQWESDPEQLWSKPIGVGFSSVAVADGRLYTMGHADGRDTVFCLDATTGKELWAHSYECALVDNLHEGGPAATPTVDGQRVYTVSKEGHLFCLDAHSGEVLWQQNFQEAFDVEMPTWGFSCSPLVVGNRLIVDAGRIAAFDKTTGEVLWKTEAFDPGYGSPINFTRGDEQLIAVLNNEFLVIVAARDGRVLDRVKWKTDFKTTATTPIIAPDGTIFISTGYKVGCARFKLVGDELEYIYDNRNLSNHMNNSVLWQGHLYGFDGNSHASRQVKVTCLDYETGETLWQERGLGCGSLMLAGGKLILLSDAGELVIAEPSPKEFKPLSRTQILDGKCWTVPVLSHGLLYARNAAGELVCVDLRGKSL